MCKLNENIWTITAKKTKGICLLVTLSFSHFLVEKPIHWSICQNDFVRWIYLWQLKTALTKVLIKHLTQSIYLWQTQRSLCQKFDLFILVKHFEQFQNNTKWPLKQFLKKIVLKLSNLFTEKFKTDFWRSGIRWSDDLSFFY